MNDSIEEAYSQVLEVLENTGIEIAEKIPKTFISFLDENKNKNYVSKIDFEAENWEEALTEDAQAILALVYRDFIVSAEERQKLINN